MHDAFEHEPILEKLPLPIECIATYDDTLLVGTRPGHLLVYGVKPSKQGEQRFEVELRRSNKLFSKKPIIQLTVVEELNILISLSDSVISVHDLVSFNPLHTLHKTRGANYFAVDLKVRENDASVFDSSPPFDLRLCVAVKRKLMLFQWRGEFQESGGELGLPDIAKAVAFSGNTICVGFKKDYYLIKINTGVLTELFPTGKHLEPSITVLPGGEIVLGRDDICVFINSDGKPSLKGSLTWTDTPILVEYVPPYIIGVLPKYIEVRSIDPRALIQSIDLIKPRCLAKGKNVYVASSSHVWRLVPVPLPTQIQQLLQDKQFQLALTLADLVNEPQTEKARRVQNIQYLYAFDLFCQRRFEESLQLFSQLETAPPQVIGLFADLLPPEFRKKLEYPAPTPTLSSSETERGYLALVEYLTQKRNDLSKAEEKDKSDPGTDTATSRKLGLSQIIDTTLLKCYLKTNDALVAPLLRLKDNNCHVEECERVLNKNKKYNELVLLYQTKGLHRKALDLLLRHSQKASGPLKGHQPTVSYLQKLGKDNLKYIFDYSVWVLKACPDDGLKIFIEDTPEIEGLPREQVLVHIEQNAKDLVIPYLEHIIFTWSETSSVLHNKLIHFYCEKVLSSLREYRESLPEGDEPAEAGKEPGDLGQLRNRLLFLLETSRYYRADTLLIHFPDFMFEERALLLGRLGRHEEALAIYIYILNDTHKAEEYCKKHYYSELEGSKDVYVCLLHMYLQPPDARSLGVMPNEITGLKPNVQAAHTVLQEHYQKINTAKALDLLPASSEVQEVYSFLVNVIEEKEAHKRRSQVLRSLLYSEHLQVQEQRMYYQAHKIVITEERACRICHKKIGTSAFVCYPTSEIVHYYCCKNIDEPFEDAAMQDWTNPFSLDS